jgi:DNA-binding Xre family transcriptional regulator
LYASLLVDGMVLSGPNCGRGWPQNSPHCRSRPAASVPATGSSRASPTLFEWTDLGADGPRLSVRCAAAKLLLLVQRSFNLASSEVIAPADCIIMDAVHRIVDVPMRTTAVEAAAARGWSRGELAQRTGLSRSTIHNLESGEYETISGKTISAIMRAFPDLPYERLFVPVDSSKKDTSTTSQEVVAA